MKFLITSILLFFSVLVFGQLDLKIGDQVKAGTIVLSNDEILPFYSLEYGEDEKITYVNTQNLETEFLYVNSIKSIEPKELTTGELQDIQTLLDIKNGVETTDFSMFQYKDETVKLANPKAGKSVVYFVRTNSSGYLINFRHFDYDKFIGKFADKGFIRYECDPGEHIFWVGASNSSYVKANLEEGKIYVIETIPTMGMAYARVDIEIPDKHNSKKYEKHKKRVLAILSDETYNKNPSLADLDKQSDYQKEIENGIEIYNKRSEKEKILLLHSSQYFE